MARRALLPDLSALRYTPRALSLVWATSPGLTLVFGALTLLAGLLPASLAWVGKHIVDAVVAAMSAPGADAREALTWLYIEVGLVVALAAAQRGINLCQSLLRALLGQRVNAMILEKALSLDLSHFEDAEFYDKLTRARREASTRPLSLVNRSFGLIQYAISLLSYGALLIAFSPWAALLLLVGGIPSFIAETRFSGEAFRLFTWRVPEARMQMYLETVLSREDHVKEVKLFGLGPMLLARYQGIFDRLFTEDRNLTIRRAVWGFLLGLLSTAAFYGAYGWVVLATVASAITLGQMTMYLLLFKQGQQAVTASLSSIGGMVEDNLYLSNLYEYLEHDTEQVRRSRQDGPGERAGTIPGDGLRFEEVSFAYPGSPEPALEGVSFHLAPGQSLALVGENGSGKTTLIKLLTRLYTPTRGRVLLDGLDLKRWDEDALRRRIGVIFQDFNRYQLSVGENVGTGDVDHLEDEPRWREAARQGLAAPFIEALPEAYRTQLGKWFKNGRELSGGQWQKIALARAFMRVGADLLVLDEPTAAMDAEAEALVFEHVRALASERMVILVSHRFSTVRMADRILVLHGGRVVEAGSHAELLAENGRYAHLFRLQAAGYQ